MATEDGADEIPIGLPIGETTPNAAETADITETDLTDDTADVTGIVVEEEVHRIVDIINEEKVILAVSSEFSLPLPTNDKFQEAE